MTMRNAVPTFGMRAALTLAVLAVVALAALLAVGSPASAQVVGGEIWSETMTVGNFPNGKGWTTRHNGIGSLSDDTFSSGPNNHALTVILNVPAPSNRIIVGLAKKLNDNELKSMGFFVGGLLFPFEDATHSVDATYSHAYTWLHDPFFGWTAGQTVAVKILASPVITIEAVSTTVEYGGNNNAAASTAEFRFTRYGSTENELSFRVSNGGLFTSGAETVTRKFTAGQSSFSNFHWAVDVDNGGNKVCSIVWTLLDMGTITCGAPRLRRWWTSKGRARPAVEACSSGAALTPGQRKRRREIAMTMRNAVPRFGMRAAVALAVLAVVALAALLAVRSPASAQITDRNRDLVRDDDDGYPNARNPNYL